MLKNTNTLEEFKALDKAALFSECVGQLWEDVMSGRAINEPHRLSRFLLISFADLKKYKFTYWFAFPALQPAEPHKLNKLSRIGDVYSQEVISSLYETHKRFGNHGYFIAKVRSDRVTLGKLSDWDTWDGETSAITIGFPDPSGLPDAAGWPVRNLLALLAQNWNVHRVTVICLREDLNKGIADSLILDINISQFSGSPPKAVGWEKNASGKLGPRISDLAPLMDPTQLANTAVDLNLKLMRWRIMPELNLEKIASTKCLMLGAGTLGSFIVINAALGFDTFLVMRHGILSDGRTPDAQTNLGNVKLGCYYCNDVVAPGDSLKDRTLDQQCTVTRPGIAAIASSIAVELLVNILNHPDGILAAPPADPSPPSSTPIPLGVMPHQVRGFLTHFSNLLVVGQQYDKCTACSTKRLVGLTDMHREADLADVEWDDEEDL
ncbi:hypothetical protein BJ742DRAFT_869846 [Cladochytrium replicatum]|nr:hypothetical protein BJ742DRAFT_869846 [Cladochytrium replicatum]